MSEREVYRLSQDLRSGNAEDAARVIHQELQTRPQVAAQELREANNMAGQNARLHVGHKADGDMAIVDNSGHAVIRLGHLQQQSQFSNYNSLGRYQDSNYNSSIQNRYLDNNSGAVFRTPIAGTMAMLVRKICLI